MLLDAAVDTLAQQLVTLTACSEDEFDAIGAAAMRDNHVRFARFVDHKTAQAGTAVVDAKGGGGGVDVAYASSAPEVETWHSWQRTQRKLHQLLQTWGLEADTQRVVERGVGSSSERVHDSSSTIDDGDGGGAPAGGDDDDDGAESSDGEL